MHFEHPTHYIFSIWFLKCYNTSILYLHVLMKIQNVKSISNFEIHFEIQNTFSILKFHKHMQIWNACLVAFKKPNTTYIVLQAIRIFKETHDRLAYIVNFRDKLRPGGPSGTRDNSLDSGTVPKNSGRVVTLIRPLPQVFSDFPRIYAAFNVTL